MSWRFVIARVGGVICAFGILVLLFVAYQLWGTGISTRLHQEQLRRQFDQELAVAHRVTHATTTTTPTPVSTTTTPTRGVAPEVPGDAPADGQPIGTIDIPAIGANYVVVQGTTTHDLQLGPGHYASTAFPGQPGNAAIAGHRTTYLAPFYNLSSLVSGDPIYITTTQGRFRYDVTGLEVVSPSDVAVLNQTVTPTLTLTTCNPRYSAAQRLVVLAALETPPAPVPAPAPTTRTTGTAARHRKAATSRSGLGLAGESGRAWPAIAWGAACGAVAVLIWLLARHRSTRVRRWAVYALGVVPVLVVLFFFFQSVSPLLPASF